MKLGLPVMLALLLTTAAGAQTQIIVPINPPPPQPFTVQVSQQATFNGLLCNVTGSLTVTPVGSGPVIGGGAITRITDATGAALTTVAGGGTLIVGGSGFGTFGTATVAGLPATVVSWTPSLVTLKAPTAGSATGTAAGPVVLKPGDAAAVTSAVTVTLTGLTAELPPPSGPTWESPVIATSGSTEQIPPPSLDELYGLLPVVPAPDPAPEFKPTALVYAAITADGKMTISGQAFGEQGAGQVEVNERRVPVLSWSDDVIVVLLISLDIVPIESASILVWRNLDDYYYGTVALNGADLG
jgi:hypothetical protein